MQSYKRFFDVLVILFFTPVLIPLMVFITIIIFFHFDGPVFFWSKRVGKNNKFFLMPKFRSMISNAPVIGKHQLDNPEIYITFFGKFLRSTSLDELPQIYSIVLGDMSLVGPRPALFSETYLIKKRNKFGINELTPGLTGYAQINGRDSISVDKKIKYDLYYKNNISIFLDIKIIMITFYKVFFRKDIRF